MPVITETLVRAARPRARKYEIACARVKGLVLRVLPSGRRVFYARTRAGGRDRRHRIGPTEEVSLAQARDAARAIVGGPRPQHAAPESPTRPPTDTATFAALARMYLTQHVETGAIRPRTRAAYRAAVTRLAQRWGERRLSELRFHDVEALHRSMADTPAAANYLIRVLSHMYTKAAQWELYPWEQRRPTQGLKLFPEEGRERFLSPEERRRLERVLREAEQTRPYGRGWIHWSHIAAIRLLSLTGMRKSEVLGLQWSWVDRAGLCVRLPESKTGKSYRPISPDVVALLDALEAHRVPDIPYVLHGTRGTPVHRSSLAASWAKIRSRAQLDDVRLHDLRHSAASDALMAGVPLAVVGAILGHRTARTTSRYAHISDRVAREAAGAMTAAILGRERGPADGE